MQDLFKQFLNRKITREQFLKICGYAAGFCATQSSVFKVASAIAAPEESFGRTKTAIEALCDLSVAQGSNAYAITRKSIETLGGMGLFVKKDSKVLIKPNIAWDRTPEQAGNTNPEVVAALIDLCFEAGARRVNVFDGTCNEQKRCYVNSGIQSIAQDHKAHVFFPSSWNIVKAKFKYKSSMENWPIYREAIECDTFINVPVVKHHGLTRLTLSMKNLMGVCGGNRGKMHFGIGQKLVDLTDFISPDLTVIDAVRVLNNHGPQGGNLADVSRLDTVIAGTDPVLCDTYACKLMKVSPKEIPYLAKAAELGFGKSNLSKANIIKVSA